MADWAQVYDDDLGLDDARSRVRRLVVGFALVSGALVSAAPIVTIVGGAQAHIMAAACGALLTISAVVVMVRLAREHRRIWRVELSVHRAVGHDAVGRRRALPWSSVDYVDVAADGIVISGRDEGGHRARLLAPLGMPGYVSLAHRAVEYAEAHRCPIWVDGQPVLEVDLALLDASLCSTETAA
ncbi:hypothetical protein [Rubrivirga sp.]|uniref:hypothetical protein n=1 Tax=Rubrivirga sp. TaxID=1885344 RepID=UPI003C771FFA